MASVRLVEHQGKQVCYIDFENAQPTEVPRVIAQAKQLIAAQPRGSVLTLTNVTEARYDQNVSGQLKEFAAHNKPYVRAGAVVGVTGLKKLIYQAVVTFSGRKLQLFDDVPTAMRWLVTQ